MSDLSRRAFLGASLIAAETLRQPVPAFAAQCVTGPLPGFLPNRLTVDCASRLNFRTFRQNASYLGLTGLVSMTYIRGKYGSYSAGNLFLFPWLKPKGLALGAGTAWPALMPINATQYRQANPIPIATLPLDEYFCRIVLRAPWPYFIGFAVDEPFGKDQATLAWFSNVDKLADGAGVRSEEHTSELQSRQYLVCRLLLEKKKTINNTNIKLPIRICLPV